MASARSRESVSSAENALLLVVALGERGRLRVAEAAELLRVTPPTAHRLLSVLKHHQFADQDRQRVYVRGRRLRELANVAELLAELSVIAHPHLVQLAQDTGETTHLVRLEGNGCRFVDGVDSTQALRVGSRVGLLLPAHRTSGGKVLLAQPPDSELASLYPERHVRMRDGSLRELATLRRELGVIRRQGCALNLEASERGVNAVGVPVISRVQKVVAAVVLACPSVRSNRQTLIDHVPRLQATAAAIAEGLHD